MLPIRVQIDSFLHHQLIFFKIGQFGQPIRIEIGGYPVDGILVRKYPSNRQLVSCYWAAIQVDEQLLPTVVEGSL